MLSLDSQRTTFNIVISDINRCKIDCLDVVGSLLSSMGYIYYMILHDKDTFEDGTPKLNHVHLVLCAQKRLRVKQVINYMCDVFQTNFANVRVDEVISQVYAVQYLLHLNDTNKFQYSRKELLSNQQETADAMLVESPQTKELTTQTLMDLIFNSKLSKLELIYAIGIGKYQHYRQTINDLYEYRRERKK